MADWSSLDLAVRPTLATDGVILSPPQAEDGAAIAEAVNDVEVARWVREIPHPYGLEDAQFFLTTIVPAQLVWAVRLAGDGELVGMVGLTPKADETSAELGYWIARPHWGKGYATAAARAALAFGVETVGLSEVVAGYYRGNEASRRILAKLGFVPTGEVRLDPHAIVGEVTFIAMAWRRPRKAPPSG
ncbi:MAG: GNAT family N-acetyltransferase [Pseudomonadota bacterium]